MSTERLTLRHSITFPRHWNTVAPLASAAIVLLFGAIAYSGAKREDVSMRLVAHTDSVIAANQAVLAWMGDQDEAPNVPTRLDALHRLVADNPLEEARADSIERWLVRDGAAALDSARRLSAAIEGDEQMLLAAQNDAQDAHESAVRWTVGVGSIVAAGLALLLGVTLARSASTQARLAAVASEANQAKARFLANMSHDLRTPLNAIIGYADLIEAGARGPVTALQVNDLQRIKRSGQHLTALINGVLDFAKVEAGRVQLKIEPVSLARTLADVESLIAPQARSAGLTVEYSCAPDLVARADGEKLNQIVVNLVGNAVKFTESGGRVDVTADRDGAAVRLVVRDTGRGIAPEQMGSIFEPFVQAGASKPANGQRGVGLGLAISRELARAMNGELTAASAPGVGSAFTLKLDAA